MNPRLVLHIGGEKTGSTSIQSYLYEHRDGLIEHGIYYSRYSNLENHTFLLDYIFNSPASPSDRLAVKAGLQEDMLVATNLHCGIYILSCELLSSHVNNKSALADLAGLLTSLSSCVEIVCYFRPQVHVHISRVQTMIKNGEYVSTKDFWNNFDVNNYFYNYAAQHDLWSSQEEFSLNFRSYTRYGVVADFLHICDSKYPIAEAEQRKNTSVDASLLAILNAINFSAAGFAHPHGSLVEDIPVDNPFCIDYATVIEKQGIFRHTNIELNNKNKSIVLDGSIENFSGQVSGNSEILDKMLPAGRVLNCLLTKYNAEYMYYRLRSNFLELQLSGLQGDDDGRLNARHECEKIVREIKLLRISNGAVLSLIESFKLFVSIK